MFAMCLIYFLYNLDFCQLSWMQFSMADLGSLSQNLQLPQWEETVTGSRTRYEQTIKALADKYPSENLLLVTHGKLDSSIQTRIVVTICHLFQRLPICNVMLKDIWSLSLNNVIFIPI